MLFNSFEFLLFLPLVFIVYWFLAKTRLVFQNTFTLGASYFFYAWWDWRFLFLIIISTVVDYYVGLGLGSTQKTKRRQLLLWLSVFSNLSILGFFKYFNFFSASLVNAMNFVGVTLSPLTLNIILPIGISFYTFQTLSYSIDVYFKRINPSYNFISFASFVSFFPQLLAGPIERASNLLPQFEVRRQFKYATAVDGCTQILWGFFKKVVIADHCAHYVSQFFDTKIHYSGSTYIMGASLFCIQVYCDFSGYSDIAIGTGKLFGFRFMPNFKTPLFSKGIAEFWTRWHISLSSWLNDYLFTPLAIELRQLKKEGVYLAVFVTFLLSGLWHGAGWNYVVFGVIHGLYYLPVVYSKKRFKSISSLKKININGSIKDFPKMLLTFVMVSFSLIFVRAENLSKALDYIAQIFTNELLHMPQAVPLSFILVLIGFFSIEWFGKNDEYTIQFINRNYPKYLKWVCFLAIGLSIILFPGEQQEFIYFQF